MNDERTVTEGVESLAARMEACYGDFKTRLEGIVYDLFGVLGEDSVEFDTWERPAWTDGGVRGVSRLRRGDREGEVVMTVIGGPEDEEVRLSSHHVNVVKKVTEAALRRAAVTGGRGPGEVKG